MEKTPFSEFLENLIHGENLKVQSSFFSRPTLQYSSTPADYYWQSLLSLIEPEGPGSSCQNRKSISTFPRSTASFAFFLTEKYGPDITGHTIRAQSSYRMEDFIISPERSQRAFRKTRFANQISPRQKSGLQAMNQYPH